MIRDSIMRFKSTFLTKSFILLTAIAALVGCESTSKSASLSNSELRIEIEDDWNGGVHHIHVFLKDRSANNRRVELTGDDELVVIIDNQSTSLGESFSDGLYYGGTVTSDEGEVTVQLSGSTRTTAELIVDLGEHTQFSSSVPMVWSEVSNTVEVGFDQTNGGTDVTARLECIGNNDVAIITEQTSNIATGFEVTVTDMIANYNDDNDPDANWSNYSDGCTIRISLEQSPVSSPVSVGFGSYNVVAAQTGYFLLSITE